MPFSNSTLGERVAVSVMSITACTAVNVADKAQLPAALLQPALLTSIGAALSAITIRYRDSWRMSCGAAAIGGGIAMGWSHAYERSGGVAAMDVLLLSAATGVLPALIAWSWQERVIRLAALLSAFVAVIATSFCDLSDALPIVTAFLFAALCWLGLSKHERLTAHGPKRATAMPAILAGLGCIALGMWAGVALSGVPMAHALKGFMPSSGGAVSGSASARNGVGNGPDEVAGDKATSAGYDQTDRFSESAKDGLYDLFIEAYGQPLKPAQHQKMIGLKAKDVHIVASEDRDDFRSSRSLQLERSAAAPASAASAQSALMYVEGRAPLHLRLATFDRYADSTWSQSNTALIPASLHPADRDHWLPLVNRPDFSEAGAVERHRIKIASLPGPELPLPPATTRFKFGRVERATFFQEGPMDVLRLARQTMPPGSVLDVEARTIDPQHRTEAELLSPAAGRWAVDAPLDGRARQLIESWTAGTRPGWAQVDAIVQHIRQRATFVRGKAGNAADPAMALLMDSTPGDDIDFATAAALALRSLGYRVRLASGFYVRPNAVDRSTGQTAVTAADVHSWPEIRLLTGAWVPLEPTPGYTLLAPAMSWTTTCYLAGCRVANWAIAHLLPIAITTAAVALLWLGRRWWIEWIDTLAWRLLQPFRRKHVHAAAKLIERRARRWHSGRPAYRTRSAWLGELQTSTRHGSATQFSALIDRAEYGSPADKHHNDCAACCAIVADFSPRAFRNMHRTTRP